MRWRYHHYPQFPKLKTSRSEQEENLSIFIARVRAGTAQIFAPCCRVLVKSEEVQAEPASQEKNDRALARNHGKGKLCVTGGRAEMMAIRVQLSASHRPVDSPQRDLSSHYLIIIH